MTTQLILLRHGQSEWNLANRFTGWHDVDLSEQGRAEARKAGETLLSEGIEFRHAFTSVLKRAIRTLWLTLDTMDRMWVPVERTWRLNERHYGALQGLDKAETLEKHGEEQLLQWRRGYAIRPPGLESNDPRHPRQDPRYADLSDAQCPATESLDDTLQRVLPVWNDSILPLLGRGENVLVAAHGNSLRAMVKHLDSLSDDAITGLNIPTGIPLVYHFDSNMNVESSGYLGDAAAIQAAAEAVANQAKKK